MCIFEGQQQQTNTYFSMMGEDRNSMDMECAIAEGRDNDLQFDIEMDMEMCAEDNET